MNTTRQKILWLHIVLSCLFVTRESKLEEKAFLQNDMYFCVAADSNFFTKLLRLIGSIHHTNFDKTKEIAIFDLGFSEDQIKFLKMVEKVSVYPVELTHPDILKYVRKNNDGAVVRGWYAWKPVAIKEALAMFPYVLYLDAGCCVLRGLKDVFCYIQKNGYLLVENQAGYTIGQHCTACVRNHYLLSSNERDWILNARPISAGIQGLSRAVYHSYIKPIYELSKDLKYFEDDGSAPLGFGWARHDQTLFSIQARLMGLRLVATYRDWQQEIPKISRQSLEAHIVYRYNGKIDFAKYIRFKNNVKLL